MRLLAVLGLTLAIAACDHSPSTIERTFDPCEPVVLDPGDATAAQREGVADAIALWQARDVSSLSLTPVPGAPSVPVRFEEANPTFHGYYDDEDAVIYVNVALDDDPAARAITIAHELGHAFGLYHVDDADRVSLMNPHNLTVPPTLEDRQALEALWGACPR